MSLAVSSFEEPQLFTCRVSMNASCGTIGGTIVSENSDFGCSPEDRPVLRAAMTHGAKLCYIFAISDASILQDGAHDP